MRTTIELPDDLMTRAKVRAAQEGLTLKELFVSAMEQRLTPERKKPRRDLPAIIDAPDFREPTQEEMAEAMIPIGQILEQLKRS